MDTVSVLQDGPFIKINGKEMARVNIDTLAISEINRLEKMNLVQVTIISTTVGKNPLEEIAAIIVNKRV